MPDGLTPPPPRLGSYAPRPTETVFLPAGTPVWRLYKRDPHNARWNTFRSHGPTRNRFDHHRRSPTTTDARSILYAAADWDTCVAEVFQDEHLIHTHANKPRLVAFTFATPVPLLDLAGPWPTRAGASMAISSGERTTAQIWSRAIYEAFPDIHGLRYASAMNAGKFSYAFYERARPALDASPLVDVPLSHPALASQLKPVAFRLGYDML